MSPVYSTARPRPSIRNMAAPTQWFACAPSAPRLPPPIRALTSNSVTRSGAPGPASTSVGVSSGIARSSAGLTRYARAPARAPRRASRTSSSLVAAEQYTNGPL